MKQLLLLTFAMLLSIQIFAQNIVANGVVKDSDGNAIVGASVTEKGSTNSTLTFTDGTFQLNLIANDEITITRTGYEKLSVKVGPDGKIPDIVLRKKIKRVQFGVKAGVDCNIFGYETETHEQFQNSEIVSIDSDPSLGYNGGVYMDLNFGRTFSFEFGLQIYKRTLKGSNIPNTDFTSLNIPIAVCKWHMGKRKQFIINWGPGIEVMLKKDDAYAVIAYSINFGIGYEFASGFGFRLTSKPWVDIPINSTDCEGVGASVGCALSYRFGKR